MSAFFGLTFLGSQGSFDPVKETPIHTFQGRDFQDAFMQTYRPGFSLYSESEEDVKAANAELDSATITLSQLPVMLRYLYKCPKGVDNVPGSARTLVGQAFRLQNGAGSSQSIDLATFLAQMDEICRHSQSMAAASAHNAYLKNGLPTREFVSNLDFRAKLVKHQRMEKDPRDKALAPVTDSITMGWYPPTIITKRMPNKSCEETRFASAMVKAGVYYY
ncbi:hypothetical protein F441_11632 [Phytophthora nicotianae CJ01A1]|uniref:Uncharacterized protein n=5 Tax=Phytophthora nicotianae TaxID=4792 RepID=V9EVL1_PHYNI|nr:hypothetical protein F443_11697 [Phytophthora nicotianae P1569]ETK83393.1 hypothetical protein L915_11387 [Phytophthora nicotianae]ETO71980.1 hypothetical protein F444_11782 [Phytophthora nicotianae P1976]ETP13116.1 hypothetical protein F441_11632 [Phytophthora nicotianae CJ01A1]ETP41193.1 hypothetical protein F442_11600 [Phytophthora nicotianae P10297]